MWTVCQPIPGEGGSQVFDFTLQFVLCFVLKEPLYGEINLMGVGKLFAVWKEVCNFSIDSEFLDVGSGLAKMVFHASIDPGLKKDKKLFFSTFLNIEIGVKKSHGIELSKYRSDTAQAILTKLLPKVFYKLKFRVF